MATFDGANLRSYGLPDSEVEGVPVAKQATAGPCPNCGCEELMEVKVTVVRQALLRSGTGTGTYLGCPACPFASPMMVRKPTQSSVA
jgi:hypothetical protein